MQFLHETRVKRIPEGIMSLSVAGWGLFPVLQNFLGLLTSFQLPLESFKVRVCSGILGFRAGAELEPCQKELSV
jgi:hypothetical protein